MPKITDQLKAIIADQLNINIEQVTPDARFINDLGIDSLDTIELILRLEEDFNIEISDEEAERLETVKDAIDLITAKV